jgi:hypothetical protein
MEEDLFAIVRGDEPKTLLLDDFLDRSKHDCSPALSSFAVSS